MSIRRLSVLPLALAFLGCAHGSSESVATTPASSATGNASKGQLVDEGPGSGGGAASAAAAAGQLVPFHSSGGFTVLMPANPQQVDRTEETPGGAVQVHVAQVSDPAAQYVSTYSEYPPGTLEKVKTPVLLDTFQRSSLRALNATLVSARDVQLDGLPGREFTASTPEGQQIIALAAQQYKAGGSVRLQVTGYTDLSGSASYNQRLSERRANAVASALAALGVARSDMAVTGRGMNDPRVPTAPGVREPQNRRVEIVFP